METRLIFDEADANFLERRNFHRGVFWQWKTRLIFDEADANFLERRNFHMHFMEVLTGHVHRRGAFFGRESVPCHDYAASWPREPAGFLC